LFLLASSVRRSIFQRIWPPRDLSACHAQAGACPLPCRPRRRIRAQGFPLCPDLGRSKRPPLPAPSGERQGGNALREGPRPRDQSPTGASLATDRKTAGTDPFGLDPRPRGWMTLLAAFLLDSREKGGVGSIWFQFGALQKGHGNARRTLRLFYQVGDAASGSYLSSGTFLYHPNPNKEVEE
jgi:hypothetical protein